MSKLETITPKQLIEELLPAKYGKADGEYKFIFQDHVIDGSIVGITYNEELLASCRIRFTNGVLFKNDYSELLLQCALTNLVYIKKATVEPQVVEVNDIPSADNVPDTASKPSSQASKAGKPSGRGRGVQRK
jgi:hypothetical protein